MQQPPNWDDVPRILNSICWQLKCQNENLSRIADALEQGTKVLDKTDSFGSSKLRDLINQR